MATVKAIRIDRDDKSATIKWTDLVNATSDVGAGAYIGDLTDLSIQAYGTSTTTVAIQGSNDGVTFDALGAGLTLTIAASTASPVAALPSLPLFIRPATPSAGADTDVILRGRRPA